MTLHELYAPILYINQDEYNDEEKNTQKIIYIYIVLISHIIRIEIYVWNWNLSG